LAGECRPRSTRPSRGPFVTDRAVEDDEGIGLDPFSSVAFSLYPLQFAGSVTPRVGRGSRAGCPGVARGEWIDKGEGPYYLSRLSVSGLFEPLNLDLTGV